MKTIQRYNSVAISLHWLIAFFLIGLLALGKYMTHLEETDSLRFTLTQWHKSFGVTVLLLVIVRIGWRVTHKPPPLPADTARFERSASHVTHLLMYLLMLVIPVSGWVFVSASPLNLETELFGIVHWPHLPFVSSIPNKEALSDQSGLVHMWLANVLLVLVLVHMGAALLHQFYHRDQLILRMLVSKSHRESGDLNHGLVAGVLLAAACGLFLAESVNRSSGISGANTSAMAANGESAGNTNATETENAATVGFTATQTGDPIDGEFGDVEVNLSIDRENPVASTLTATVATGSVYTGDSQMDGTMVTAGWFASKQYPDATFVSKSFDQQTEASYSVSGDMTIRGETRLVTFELSLDDKVARGEFTITRSDFGVGDDGQDEFVDQEVVIRFQTPYK